MWGHGIRSKSYRLPSMCHRQHHCFLNVMWWFIITNALYSLLDLVFISPWKCFKRPNLCFFHGLTELFTIFLRCLSFEWDDSILLSHSKSSMMGMGFYHSPSQPFCPLLRLRVNFNIYIRSWEIISAFCECRIVKVLQIVKDIEVR